MLNSRYYKTDVGNNVPAITAIDAEAIELKESENNNVVSERGEMPKELILISDNADDAVATASYSSLASFNDKYASKGKVNFRLSFPYVNWFYLAYETNNDKRSNVGFLGVSGGLDYFYSNKAFLNISVSGIMDAFVPFPAPVDYMGLYDHMYSVFASISNNHMINNKFSVGYGISYGTDQWNTINHGLWSDDAAEEEVEQESVYRKSNSVRLVVPFYYYTKRSFYMGIAYRPILLQITDKTRFQYQHTLSFDFGWRIHLQK